MANYNIYRYEISKNNITYKLHFHFGGKTGSNLGTIDLPPDAVKKVEIDFSMNEERLTGLETAKTAKITFDTALLHNLYGDTFIDNLYNGSEVTGTDRNISLPSMSVVTFDYPNRLYITENTGLGDNKIFDGLQKFELSNFEFDESGELSVEFGCIGAYILQNILMNDRYLDPTYEELTYYNAGGVYQTMDGNTYASTLSQTHVLYDMYYNSGGTAVRVEMKDEARRDIVFGSLSIKEIIEDINTCAQVMYDALTRAEISPQFIITNTDTDNILHNLNLNTFNITGSTSSSYTSMIAYNSRIITAIFDFRDNGGVLEIYQSDDLFKNFEFKNAFDFIDNLLENSVSRATFTYGTGSVKLNWHWAKQSRFSSTSGDTNLSYSITPVDRLGGKIEKYFKPSVGTNVNVPLLMSDINDYTDTKREDRAFYYTRKRRFQAPTDEINLQFHNLNMIPSNHRRNREVKNGYKPAFVTLPNYNGLYTNITLSTKDGNYYALLKISDYCSLELSNSLTIISVDTAQALPIQDPADEKKSGSVFAKRLKNWIDIQQTQAGLHYVVGKAYNTLYEENQKLVLITEGIYLRDFGKTVTISNPENLISGYMSNKLDSNFVITGIRSAFDGYYELTLVSI